jgi:cyclohexanecarboxylate-CoA ligase
MDAERAVAAISGWPVRSGVAMILDDVDRHARDRPGERAVAEVGADGGLRELTWSALVHESERVARLLASLGVQSGEPVAFQLPNRLEFVTIALATLRIGAVCEPLMPILRERELEFMLRESGARVLFVPDVFRGRDHAAMADAIRPLLPGLEHVVVLDAGYRELLERAPDDPPPARPRDDAVAQLLFTSGTSGEPKGALHRHDVLMRAADHHIAHFGLGTGDVIYVPSPLAHQTGFLYGMWIALRLGVPQIIQEVWDAEVGLDLMRRFGATFIQAATPFLSDLTKVAQERGETPERLRTFVATGAAIPRELARRAREALDADVGGAWGTTESCLGCAFAPGDPPELAWGTDGRALDGVRLRVTDDEGRALAAGAEGNFEVHTDCLFVGYLNRPELTAEAITPDGWYRTGDLARIDDSGYVRITGRVKDVINRGGEKVPVAEIEQLLHSHPAVRDVAIVAMPDERLGERACAFAVLQASAEFDLDEMMAYLDSCRVSKTYWPERLELVDTLPRTPSGKIQKFLLRACARELVLGASEVPVLGAGEVPVLGASEVPT